MPSNPIDYITLKGFKSIASVEKLELRPINVVIGPNGSGKSNFIGVFGFLHAIREGRLREYVTAAGGAEKVLHFGSKTTKELRLDLSFHGGSQYELRLSPTSDDGLFPSEETAFLWNEDRAGAVGQALPPSHLGRESGISDPRNEGNAECIRHHLDRKSTRLNSSHLGISYA